MAVPSLSDVANGIRTLFAQVVGADVAANPHLLTRTYAKGVTVSLYLMGIGSSGAVPIVGASASLAIQVANPDWSLTTVSSMTAGPSAPNGLLAFSDTQTVFDLTKQYSVIMYATLPDGTAETAPTFIIWNYPPGGNWGSGFTLTWLGSYVAGGSPATSSTVQGVVITVYPTSGTYPFDVQVVASPNIADSGATYWWGDGNGKVVQAASASRYLKIRFSASLTLHCVMTDSAGKTYISPSVAITVSSPPPGSH